MTIDDLALGPNDFPFAQRVREELMRLAEKWESEAAGWQSLPKHMKASIGDAQARISCAAELRQLTERAKCEPVPAPVAYVSMKQLEGLQTAANGSQPKSVMLSRDRTRHRRVPLHAIFPMEPQSNEE